MQRRTCVFCDSNDHKSVECTVVTKTAERRDILRQKRLCFTCTGGRHRALEYQSKGSCKNCKVKHHSSICDKSQSKDEVLLATGEMGVVYPVVIVRVEGLKFRALFGALTYQPNLLRKLDRNHINTSTEKLI